VKVDNASVPFVRCIRCSCVLKWKSKDGTSGSRPLAPTLMRTTSKTKVRGLKFNTCLQPSHPQYAATELSLAAAEGQTPLDFTLDTNAKVLACLAKFLHGLTDDCNTALTPKKYFIQRLLNKDRRFASDANYLFYAQHVTEMKQIGDNIRVAMRQTAGHIRASTATSAAQLRQLIKRDIFTERYRKSTVFPAGCEGTYRHGRSNRPSALFLNPVCC